MLISFILTIIIIWVVHVTLMKNGYYNDVHIMQRALIKKAFQEKELTTIALILLWTIGFLMAIIILLSIINFPDNRTSLFSAFSILVSAFMASVAMLKSIKQSQIHKEEEIKNKLKRNIYYLHDQANEIVSILQEIKNADAIITYKESLYELLSKKHSELNIPDITYNLDENLLKKFQELKYPLMKILLELFKVKNKTSWQGEQTKLFELIEATKAKAIEFVQVLEK